MQETGDDAAADGVLRLVDAGEEYDLANEKAGAQVLVYQCSIRLLNTIIRSW